jgi:predicted DCC family thiol-disulfide oxidoreductase YuxK
MRELKKYCKKCTPFAQIVRVAPAYTPFYPEFRRYDRLMSTKSLSKSAKTTTLVFDGDCGFCTTSVNWLERNLPAFPSAVPFQWADLESLGVTEDEARERVWLITEGKRFGGHLAVSVLLRHQPTASWRFLGWLIAAPGFSLIAAAGYALVARYRYRLPGGTPACKVPQP